MKAMTRVWAIPVAVIMSAGILAGCGDDSGDEPAQLTLYSGRSESLVGPLIEKIGTEIAVTPAYDKKAAQILEEGDKSPADLFFAQDAGELGALADAGLLEPLPDDIAESVPQQYRTASKSWAATSGRSRALVYNPDVLAAADLPPGIDGLTDPKFRGKVGFAPTNASFKSFVTGLRVVRGEDGARDWLTKFLANDPKKFDGNGAILEAVNDGSLGAGLLNHYYWVQAVAEEGIGKVPSRLHFFGDGDPGALVNVAGVAVLKSSDDKEEAFDFVRQLLTPETQKFFTTEVGEYAVADNIPLPVADLPPLISDLKPPKIDLDDLADVAGTEKLLTEVGAV